MNSHSLSQRPLGRGQALSPVAEEFYPAVVPPPIKLVPAPVSRTTHGFSPKNVEPVRAPDGPSQVQAPGHGDSFAASDALCPQPVQLSREEMLRDVSQLRRDMQSLQREVGELRAACRAYGIKLTEASLRPPTREMTASAAAPALPAAISESGSWDDLGDLLAGSCTVNLTRSRRPAGSANVYGVVGNKTIGRPLAS